MTYITVGRQLLVAWAVPILGGIAQYLRFRDEDKRLANLLLAGTFGIPVLLAVAAFTYQTGYGIGVAIGAAVAANVLIALVWRDLLNENPYKELLWACYLFVPGALYVYYGPYSDQPRLRRAAGNFIKESLVLAAIVSLMAGTML